MKRFAFHLSYIFLLLYLPSAFADQVYPVITYTCDEKADVLKIKNEAKWGEVGENFKFSEADGIYNPWDWVEMEDRGSRRLVRQSKSVELTCKLSGVTYKVVLEPKLFNPNYFGKCGDKLSAKVSIYMGKDILLENKALEQFCHGNAKIIRGIKVYGAKRKLKLYKIAKHKFY
jgi:hypothetical protein